MSQFEHHISRRHVLRSMAGFVGVGVVGTSLGGYVLSKHNVHAMATGVASATNSTQYLSLANFRPPPVTIDVTPTGTTAGVVLTDCHKGLGQQGPMIIGPDGSLVWFQPLADHGSPSLRAFNLRVQQYRGRPVLTWFQGAVVAGHGQGNYVVADTSYRQIATVRAGNGEIGDLHEFFLTPSGTAIFTVYGQATADLTSVGGLRQGGYLYGEVQEVDVATGKLLFSWRSDHYVTFAESYKPAPKSGPLAWDYFHINSVAIDPVDNNLLVSSRNCWAVYKVNRKTGAVMWRLGGKRNNFAMGAKTRFAYQHHVTAYAGGIFTIFDNEGSPNVQPQSRALVLKVDQAKRTATLVHQFFHSPPVSSGALGSVQILSNGNYFVGWGASTFFTEYDPTGRVLFDGRLVGKNLESYRAFRQVWIGRPLTLPSLSVVRSASATVLYASWNGATGVVSWRVLAGGATGALTPVATVARKGFETRISLTTRPVRVAVEALDAGGKVLKRSVVHLV